MSDKFDEIMGQGADAFAIGAGASAAPDPRSVAVVDLHLLVHAAAGSAIRSAAEQAGPDGTVVVSAVDFDAVCAMNAEGKAGQAAALLEDSKTFWNEGGITDAMREAGLIRIRRNVTGREGHISMIGIRPEIPFRMPSAAIFLSSGRLLFGDQIDCIMRVVHSLHIPFNRACGADWGEKAQLGLIALLEQQPDLETVIMTDFDTTFGQQDVKELLRLMGEWPEADAIAAVQVKRGSKCGWMMDPVDPEAIDWDQPLVPVRSSHFGFTALRMARLRKLPKPWFLQQADPDGNYGTPGAVPVDTTFWRGWEKAQFSAYVAPRIHVGHLELMVKMPDPKTLGCFHKYLR